jgi:hypothetical protein
MIALITAILGALTGMVPGVLQLFTQKADHAYQLQLQQLQLQAAKEGKALEIDLANSQADIQQQQSLYKFAGDPSGVRWVDGVNTLVRPYITLIVFHVWIGVEIALVYYGLSKGYDVAQLAKAVWDENTQAIFSAIVGFWFGNRMLTRGAGQPMAATIAVSAPARKATAPASAPLPAPKPPAAPAIIPEPPGSRP